jgi:SAM-dependent methyltransferase
MMDASVAPEYFEQLYAAHADPWGYETNPYETGKYAVTLRLLPRRRFRCGFEIGCSIGVLTRLLAERCDWLLAVDVSELSLARARERCGERRDVKFARMRIPRTWPAKKFDLIVLSEVLYYQSRRDGWATSRKIMRGLRPGGVVMLVHWLGETGTARSGDDAARQFIQSTRRRLRVVLRRRNARYRLDLLTTRDHWRADPR